MVNMLKVNKTCDACRHRKIRCIVANTEPGKPPVCVYCEKRNEPCHFSVFRRRAAAKVTRSFPEVASLPLRVDSGELLIDRILQQGAQEVHDATPEDTHVIKIKGERATCAPLAFFSDQRVRSLCEKIGSNRPQALVEKLEELIMTRIRNTQDSPWASIDFAKPPNSTRPSISLEESKLYIDAYFKNLHPVYPFLDRQEFEQKALGPDRADIIDSTPAFSALYHAVCALGAEYYHGILFQPGSSKSWKFFQVSLGHMPELLMPGQTVEHLQALIAISIFSQSPGCMQLEDGLIWHAARAAMASRSYRCDVDAKTARAFWVIYVLEKQLCLEDHVGSTIADADVGCAVPITPESMFGTFNWLLSSVRCARISSIAYQTLFSVSATLADTDARILAIANVRRLIEDWRLWVPPDFRPGEPLRAANFTEHAPKLALLYTHFWYYSFIITLERLTLYLDKNGGARVQQSRLNLMNVARSMAEMTRFVELGAHVPMFIISVAPLSALFILFDFVIHNPRHQETRSNLVALDSLAGFFSLVEYASAGAFQFAGTLIAEFAEIAREYYCKVQQTPPGTLGTRPPALGDAAALPKTSSHAGADGSDANVAGVDTPSEGRSVNSDYLVYPTPHNFEAATDMQMFDTVGFNKSLFGWPVQDWADTDFDFGAMNVQDDGQIPVFPGTQ